MLTTNKRYESIESFTPGNYGVDIEKPLVLLRHLRLMLDLLCPVYLYLVRCLLRLLFLRTVFLPLRLLHLILQCFIAWEFGKIKRQRKDFNYWSKHIQNLFNQVTCTFLNHWIEWWELSAALTLFAIIQICKQKATSYIILHTDFSSRQQETQFEKCLSQEFTLCHNSDWRKVLNQTTWAIRNFYRTVSSCCILITWKLS